VQSNAVPTATQSSTRRYDTIRLLTYGSRKSWIITTHIHIDKIHLRYIVMTNKIVSLKISQWIWYKRFKKTSCLCMKGWIQCSRSQTADELSVTLCWQQPMENVWLVSYLFKQCFTLFITSVWQHRDVECAIRNETFPRITWNTRRWTEREIELRHVDIV